MTVTDETFNTIEDLEPVEPAGNDLAKSFRGRKRNVLSGHSNFMLAAMFLVGAAALFVLRMNVRPQIASGDQATTDIQVDAAIKMLDSKVWTVDQDHETSTIIDTFSGRTKQRQIPAWKLTGNPFVFRKPAPKAKRRADLLSAPYRAYDTPSEEERLAVAMAAVRELSLQSVLMGPSGSVAMISNNLLAEGGKVSGWTVAKIQPKRILLTWGARRHILTLPK